MNVRKRLLSLLFCALFTTSTYAEINVGVVFFYPPYVISLDEGFDIDYIHAICARLKQKCNLVPMDYHALFGALTSGKVDIAIGGLLIFNAPMGAYIFSLPYMLGKGQYVIPTNSTFTSVKDLDGQKIGVFHGFQDEGLFFNYISTNHPTQQPIGYDDMEDIMTALSSGKVSAAFLDASTVEYWQQSGGGQFKPLEGSWPVGEGIGILALPENGPLIAQINQIIKQMEQDSTYLNLYNTYFSSDSK